MGGEAVGLVLGALAVRVGEADEQARHEWRGHAGRMTEGIALARSECHRAASRARIGTLLRVEPTGSQRPEHPS
jgi:hypothetical protein